MSRTLGRTRGTLRVTDNGPGIPEEVGERIFQPFYTGRAEGTGLASLCRTIVGEAGGRLWLDSDYVGGASFALSPRPSEDDSLGSSVPPRRPRLRFEYAGLWPTRRTMARPHSASRPSRYPLGLHLSVSSWCQPSPTYRVDGALRRIEDRCEGLPSPDELIVLLVAAIKTGFEEESDGTTSIAKFTFSFGIDDIRICDIELRGFPCIDDPAKS